MAPKSKAGRDRRKENRKQAIEDLIEQSASTAFEELTPIGPLRRLVKAVLDVVNAEYLETIDRLKDERAEREKSFHAAMKLAEIVEKNNGLLKKENTKLKRENSRLKNQINNSRKD